MKIAIVGAGNAGCFTALHYSWYTHGNNVEIELIYDPTLPSESVGQGTSGSRPLDGGIQLLWDTTKFNWYNNTIHATMKSGILYEGWGKKDKHFHATVPNLMAMHYCPWELQREVLKSGLFKVREEMIDPMNVDADYVFDCRGKPKDYSEYDELINPTNASILAKPNWNVEKDLWSSHVATPDGWTFIIPTHPDSPSHNYCVGYCYNSNITSKEDAEKHMLEMFDVEVTKHVSYKNYVAKNPIIDDRIFLQGNRLLFLEPMESTSLQTYIDWTRLTYDVIIEKNKTFNIIEKEIKTYIKQVQNFILWHYQSGSKYNTPFWKYAKSLTFNDPEFDQCVNISKLLSPVRNAVHPFQYGQWSHRAFKNWNQLNEK